MKIEINRYLIERFFSLIELQRLGEQKSLIWLDNSVGSHFSRNELEEIATDVNKLEIRYKVSISLAADEFDKAGDTYGFLSIDNHELYQELLQDFKIKDNQVIYSTKDVVYVFENGCIVNLTQGKIKYGENELDIDFSTQSGLFLQKLLTSAPTPVSNKEIVRYLGLQDGRNNSDTVVKIAKGNFKKILKRLKMPEEQIKLFITHPKGMGCRFGYSVRPA